MNYLRHLISSKGIGGLLNRFLTICRNFGVTSEKSHTALRQIISTTRKYGCKPTFFITADLLDYHAELIESVCNDDVAVGLHGHHHVDHSYLESEAQHSQFEEGLLKFRKVGIPVRGFRAPFLRFNEDTNKAAKDNSLQWVSHTVALYRHLIDVQRNYRIVEITNLIQSFYNCKENDEEPSIPCWGDHCLDIPVSCPDDEILVDRYGMGTAHEIAEVMLDMLRISHQNGECVNFLFHPERVRLIAPAIAAILEEANSLTDLWIASLDDISKWWHERSQCTFEIMDVDTNCFRIVVHGNDRGSARLQEFGGVSESIARGENGSFMLQSSLRPTVCILPGFCDKGAACLRNEGFVVETAPDPAHHSVSLGGTCTKNRRKVLHAVSRNRGPLLRFWRWPDHYKSAMAISFDLDSITLWDFIRRGYHFWRYKPK
jgi:hypothetical protein